MVEQYSINFTKIKTDFPLTFQVNRGKEYSLFKNFRFTFLFIFSLFIAFSPTFIFGQTTDVILISGQWTAPACVNSIDIQMWGGGGAGGGQPSALIDGRAGGGGGGGAFTGKTGVAVVAGTTYNITVGTGGTGGTGNGQAGGTSTATFGGTTITAAGGSGGSSGSNGNGGAGGVAVAGGFAGGNGAKGVDDPLLSTAGEGGGGGGGGGTIANGGDANGSTGGTGGAASGGNGGNGQNAALFGIFGNSGSPGTTYGGGGGGGIRGALLARTGGDGAAGAVKITYTVGIGPTMTSASVASMCSGNSINIPLTADVAATFTWIAADNGNTTGESTALQTTSTINDFITDNAASNQDVIYTVTPTATVGGCLGTPQTVTVTVKPTPVLSSTLTPAAICSGTTFTYTATSASSSPTFSWTRPTIAGITEPGISGVTGNVSETLTNTTSSPINVTYVFTTTSGVCIGNAENVVVAVNSDASIVLSSGAGTDNKSVCTNAVFTDITYTVSGATGASAAGLPTGTAGAYNSGVFTISGTPSVAGVYDYTVTSSGGCTQATATGTITVGVSLTSPVGTDVQRVCRNTAITNITYAIGGVGAGATVTGLPPGVTDAFSGSTVTISGTPTAAGTYNYTVTATGPCAPEYATGSITVGLGLITQGTDTQTVCKNTPIADIDYTIVGGDAPAPTVAGLPDGVSGSVSAPGVFTISGTPSIEGYYTYSVSTNGTCTAQSTLTGNITVGVGRISAPGTDTQSVCKDSPILDIVYGFAGGDVPAPSITGLPDGVTGSVTSPGVFTISGTPTVDGLFTYTISTNGSCATQSSLGGEITVGVGLQNAGNDTQSVCKDAPILDIVYSFAGGDVPPPTVSGLPGGVSGSISSPGVFTISGTPSEEGTFIYTVTSGGSCASPSSLSGSITVGIGLIVPGTNNQGVCKNSPIVDIDYTVVGGDVPPSTVTGLPPGVSGSITAPGIFTISGTPSVEGLYTYTVTSGGSCASSSSLSGSISVGMQLMSAPGTDTQSVCMNSPIIDIVYGYGGGDVPPPTITGLPPGVSGSITGPGVFTITGIPTIEGTYDFLLSTNGSCATQSSMGGRITVGIGLVTAGTDTQSVCKNTPIVDIQYRIVGGDVPPPTVTGLPAGVSGNITSAGRFTISGTPSEEGNFIYTVTTAGTCTQQSSLSGKITVGIGLVTPGTDDQSVCKNTPIVDIDYEIVGGDVPPPTVTGLPGGVAGSITSPGIFTISGTPSVEGLFTYTVTTNGTCLEQSSLSGSIAVGMKLSSAPGTDTQSVCKNTPIIDITYAFAGGDIPAAPAVTGLPPGVSGSVTSPGVYTISGTPNVEGTFNYSLTTNGSCVSQSTLGGRITVGLGLIVPGTDTQSVCKNTPIADINYRVVGGDVPAPTVTGLPDGVSGSITSTGVFTIGGTPSVEGRFIYTVTTAGTCAEQSSLSGSITVGLGLRVPGTDTQSICKNTPIIDIEYAIVGGDVPAPSVTGLPAGVSGSITSPGIFTISGTPSVEGLFIYTVTTNGSCLSQSSLSGSLAIGMQLTSAPGTDSQKVCKQTPIIPITYAFAGGNIAPPTITGLPGGVSGSITGSGQFTISGTPTVEGLFSYVFSTNGSCASQSSLGGTITVGLGLQVSGTDTQSVCKNIPITDIVYTIVGGDVPPPMVTGLPTGVSGSFTGAGEFTISGTPASEGTFIYTITTTGSCAVQSTLGGSITVGLGLITPGTDVQTVCLGDPIIDIPYSIVGGDVPPPMVTGLPGGVTGSITSAGVFTIEGTPTAEGTFIYTITTNGSCATQSTLTGTITVNNAPISLLPSISDNQKICNNTPITSITYTIGGTGTGATTSPLLPGLTTSYVGGVFTISGSPDTTSGTYTFTVMPTGSCTQAATTFTITITSPQAAFTHDIDSGGPPLPVNFTNNSIDADTYVWLFGDGDTASTFNTSHTYTTLGVQNVLLIASFNGQCPDTATSIITIYKFVVPNVFTPNGDNVNDMFIVNSTGLESLDVEIYNRWGLKMVEWHTTGGGWDGHNAATNGECPAGIYYYMVKAGDIDGGQYSETGIITLIR